MKGDCYEAAARFVVGNARCPGILLAHGEVTGQGPIAGIRYGHAWAEIGDALKTKAEHPYYGGGRSEDYLEHRDERIQKLIENDLTQLVKVAGKSRRSKKD